MNPRAARRLFKGRPDQLAGIPTYGEVPGEGVYLLTRKRALRIPPPPTLRNHGNWIVSISQMSPLSRRAGRGRRHVRAARDVGDRLLVDHGRVVGIRSGDKGRGREGEPLGNFEPGADIRAKVTVLAEGTAGHLTGAALDHFGLHGREPQIWELGVKEVWRVEKPLRKIVHTLGWPLRKPAKYREFGGSWLYPMGDDMVSLGFVVGLDYRDVELSAHDLLQEFKTHPFVRKILEGGERVAWGAKTITSGGWHAMPRSLGAPGLLLAGESAGLVDLARLKGVHYAIESGPPCGRGGIPVAPARREPRPDRRLRRVRRRRARRLSRKGPARGSQHAPGIREGFLHRRRACERDDRDEREAPAEGVPQRVERRLAAVAHRPGVDVSRAGRRAHLRQALVCLRLRQPHARRSAEPHSRGAPRARDVAEMWAWMCPAQVYEVGEADGDGTVELKVTPSNCVQCGAISARGGRLTPPEGGSGPEYTLT